MTLMIYRHKPARLTLLALIFALGACGTTPPSNFYTLEPVTERGTGPVSTEARSAVHIGVGPIQLAEYLNRNQMVTRTQRVRVNLSETHRWAEPLQVSFARILAENLSILVNTDKVSLHPSRNWPDIDYQVLVNVWQFDASKQGNVTLVANWSIRTNKGSNLLFMKKSVFSADVGPAASYDEIAVALSKTVEMLSYEIAGVIGKQEQ
ncbi:MAG: PqiC family protein [Gammaproteobacteria bacterium]